MKKGLIVAMVAACMFMVHTTEAHPHHRVVKANTARKSIKRGVRSGQLTVREARVLRAQQTQVRQMKRVAAADGRITRSERVVINRAQRNVNRNIYRQKHDRQVRRW